MAVFDPAIEQTLVFEGGYSADAVDPGGETNFGIAKSTHPNVDIRNLSRDEAKQIYAKEYWKFTGVDDQAVANKIFDMCVNMGLHQAILLVQRCCGELGQATSVDGSWGTGTQAAVNACDPDALLNALRSSCCTFYMSLVNHRPSMAKYLKGWLTRANA